MHNVEIIHAAAHQTMAYPFKVWGFGEGIALEALWTAGEQLAEPTYQTFVIECFERWLARDVQEPDHSAPGDLLLTVYEAHGDERYLERALTLAEHMASLPEEAGSGARLHRPTHPDYHEYLYVDCLEVDAPFLARLGQVTGESRYFDDAARQILGYTQLLQDSATGLYYHQYNRAAGEVNGAFWGRGNGWALLGLVKTLRYLPSDHAGVEPIRQTLRRLCAALVRTQHAEGNWSTVLNQPNTYREGSLPAMFCVGLREAVALGCCGAEGERAAEKAFQAMLLNVSGGLLQQVSIATPPGDSAHYNQITTGAGFPWGQGPLLLALLQNTRV